MKVKGMFSILIGLMMCSSMVFAQSYGHSDNEEYYQSQEYYDTHIDIPHGKITDLVCDKKNGTITFKIEYFFDGTEVKKDITLLIDKDTYIPEYESEISPNVDKFISGEHKWISFFITQEDNDRIDAMALGDSITVHVDRVWDICESVQTFPSPEEIKRNERLKNYGIMVGDENGNFNPYQALTRAELTKIAVVMSNPDFMKNVNLDGQSFSDVNFEHWAHPYIEYAKANGIIDGYEDGTFKPEQDVTVQEMLKIMICLLGYEPQAEATGGYPHGYIKTASRLGLLEGIAVEYDTYTIRTETADVINKALDIPLMKPIPEDEAVYAIYDGTSPEYPLQTLEIQNFKAKAQG